MEPKILLVGRSLDTLAILKEELVIFNRDIIIANSVDLIQSALENKKVDLIIVGAGLPDDTMNKMVGQIERTAPNLPLHIMERTPGITPASMIGYTNEKAVMWKLMGSRKAE